MITRKSFLCRSAAVVAGCCASVVPTAEADEALGQDQGAVPTDTEKEFIKKTFFVLGQAVVAGVTPWRS